jgi:hypothetical protein
MFCHLDAIFGVFRPCFSRTAAFHWFCIIIVGFYVRVDHEGLTSFIRWLSLAPICYDSLVHFFYATSWGVDTLFPVWVTWVLANCPLREFHGRHLLIGDGIKIAKEARKMPGVKSLHQESANNSKKASISGHHFGVAGILAGTLQKALCLPLRAEVHEGVDTLRPSEGLNGQPPTLVTRMARLLLTSAETLGSPCYAVLDAYFAVGPTFLILKERLTDSGVQLVHLITRAKDNTVAYFEPEPGNKRFQEKDKVKLMEVFDHPTCFTTAEITLYGTTTTISYCCLDLLWKPIGALLRFVLVQQGEKRFILMSSDLTLPALSILDIYAWRTKIEVMFDVLKNLLGGFCYHFWTACLPKRQRGKTTDLSCLTKTALQQVNATLSAVERFVTLAIMAVGILQFLSLTIPSQIWHDHTGWLRTYSSSFPSERIVKTVIATDFFERPRKVRCSRTFQIIQTKKRITPVRTSSLWEGGKFLTYFPS